MSNPANPAQASLPVPPPLVKLPWATTADGQPVMLTPMAFGFLQTLWAAAFGNNGVLDLESYLIAELQAPPFEFSSPEAAALAAKFAALQIPDRPAPPEQYIPYLPPDPAPIGTGSGVTFTDGSNTVADATTLTVTGGTVGGSTPNATLSISSGGGGQHKYEAFGSLDPTSGMTAVHVSSVTLTQGALSIRAGWTASASNTVQYYYEAAPGSTPWDVYLRYDFVNSSAPNSNDQYGLVVGNSTSGKFLLYSRSVGSAGLSVQEWTNATTFSSQLATKTFDINQTPTWLHIHSDGTTLTLEYSFDGSLWVSLTTRTIGTFLSSLNATGYGGVPFTAGEAWISNFGTTTPT